MGGFGRCSGDEDGGGIFGRSSGAKGGGGGLWEVTRS